MNRYKNKKNSIFVPEGMRCVGTRWEIWDEWTWDETGFGTQLWKLFAQTGENELSKVLRGSCSARDPAFHVCADGRSGGHIGRLVS